MGRDGGIKAGDRVMVAHLVPLPQNKSVNILSGFHTERSTSAAAVVSFSGAV